MRRIVESAARVYSAFTKTCAYLQSPLLLCLRLYWGWQFFTTGLGKLKDIDKVVDFFTSLNIPHPALMAHAVGLLECGGGALLFVGLASRLISLPLTVNMLVAYITADHEALFSFLSDPGKFYGADPFTFLMASLLVLIFGPGRISLDFAIGYFYKRSTGTSRTQREV